MKETVLKRLDAIEDRCKKDHMIVIGRDKNTGEEAEMTAYECLERDAEFIKVVKAGDLAELDLLLKAVWDEAWRMA